MRENICEKAYQGHSCSYICTSQTVNKNPFLGKYRLIEVITNLNCDVPKYFRYCQQILRLLNFLNKGLTAGQIICLF